MEVGSKNQPTFCLDQGQTLHFWHANSTNPYIFQFAKNKESNEVPQLINKYKADQ